MYNDMRNITQDYSYVNEIVDSRFDNIMNSLSSSKTTLIYGGILRDIVAGIEPEGDLDIISKNNDFLLDSLSASSKWAIYKQKIANYKLFNASIVSFINYSGRIIQIIRPNTQIKDIRGMVDYLSQMIDFTCCGFCLFPDGELFEYLPNAEEDCHNKIIRQNPQSNKPTTQVRLDKFIKNGWESVGSFSPEVNTPEKATKKSTSNYFLRHFLNTPIPIESYEPNSNLWHATTSGTKIYIDPNSTSGVISTW